ncbi:hypothetical protein PoB_006372800 [Plakobranchus ocellatus]|uniref:Uncharacterized protein n=1 Tax=Plakobranchus ocellatus TaxID=259542 RepID=A0AAV4CZJ4_9GAST|nr:hypothetical protein PoB_006372800 [Plakobranchus ocellatus]
MGVCLGCQSIVMSELLAMVYQQSEMTSLEKKNICYAHSSEFSLRSEEILLSRVRAPPPALWPDGGPKRLRSPCRGLAI